MSKAIRCALYPRVSTEEQLVNGLSLETQKTDLIAYACRMGYRIAGIYEDGGISARKPVSKRPALLRLLEDVRQDKIDIILVTKLDRWFRNIKEYQITEDILKAHNCYWKTIYEDYDTSTANGQMVVNIMLAVAQNECDRTSERIKAVFEHKKRNQEHLNGPVPFGYKNIDKHLKKDSEQSEIVEKIFRRYFSTYSKRDTIYYITELYGDKAPTRYQINRMLTSEVYAGMRYGKDGYCEPYISKEQHERILKACQSKTYPNTAEPYLFSQLIKCPHCGRSLTGYVRRYTCKDGSVTESKAYRCDKKFQKGHFAPCVREHVVESYMLENFYPDLQHRIYSLKEESAGNPPKNPSEKIHAEMDRLNILFQKGRITMEYYDHEYSRLEKKLSAEKTDKHPAGPKSCRPVKKVLTGSWIEAYRSMDYQHRKIFWKSVIEEILIDPYTHKLCGIKLLSDGCGN